MLTKSEFHPSWKPRGVFAAALTPMNADLSVNSALLIDHCRRLLSHGADGIALMGTTGEANSFSVAEKMNMLEGLVAGGIPAERLIVGTGCCAVPDTVALTRHAVQHGVAGVLMLPPFYYKGVSDDGLFASYDAVIQRVGDERLRIYLYHFPRMSATPLSLALIERLLTRYPVQIIGIKDSSGDWSNMKSMIEQFPGFSVFAGTEALLLDILKAGGEGCISASVNVTSVLSGQIFREWQTRPVEDEQARLTAIRLALQAHSFIPGLKALMSRYSGDTSWTIMRPPHVPVAEREIDKMQATLDELGFEIALTGR